MNPILFIDPGSIISGYAWREGKRIISGTIKAPRKRPIWDRLKIIRAELEGILEGEDNPLFSRLVVEIPMAHDYSRSMGKRGKQVTTAGLFILSRALGVIQECCVSHDMAVTEIEATLWTKGFPKAYRVSGASQIANTSIKDENEADAICLMDWWERIGQYGR